VHWAASLPCARAVPGKTTGRVGIVDVGHALLCSSAAADSAQWQLIYFFYFSEYIQILANAKICVGFI
jgi:hypothetical protein